MKLNDGEKDANGDVCDAVAFLPGIPCLAVLLLTSGYEFNNRGRHWTQVSGLSMTYCFLEMSYQNLIYQDNCPIDFC